MCFNESMIATAQREAVYIYNAKCVETHVLRRSMPLPLKLEYLPYHFLLCSIGVKGKKTKNNKKKNKNMSQKTFALFSTFDHFFFVGVCSVTKRVFVCFCLLLGFFK